MSSPELFSVNYYKKVVEDHGYDPDVFDGFSGNLEGLSEEDLRAIFVCHSDLYTFRDSSGPKSAITGFGLSGVPHLGTVSQLYRASLLNERGGYDVEVILGDLDAYNGKNIPLQQTMLLAEAYERFIEKTKLLEGSNVAVRSQAQNLEALHVAYVIGKYVTPGMYEGTEEDLHGMYVARGKVDSEMTFRRKLSLNLMIADFIHLGQTHPNVLVMLGIDEHKYVKAGQQIASSVNETESGLRPVHISSIYTPIIRGLRGFPKMSKSFPESSISLEMDEKEIEDVISGESDDYRSPEESVIFQIACGIGVGGGVSVQELYTAAKERKAEWTEIKELVIRRVSNFAINWKEAVDGN